MFSLQNAYFSVSIMLKIFEYFVYFLSNTLSACFITFLRGCHSSYKSFAYLFDNWSHFKAGSFYKRNWLLKEIFRDFFHRRRIKNHRNELSSFVLFKVTLLLGSYEVVSVVYFVNENLTELIHVFEHLMRQFDTPSRIFKSLVMVLILT